MSHDSPTLTAETIDSVRRFAGFLEERIGVPFSLCVVNGSDSGDQTDPPPALITNTDLEHMAGTAERRGFALSSCDERHTTTVVRVPGIPATQMLAVGVVPTKQTSMLERLVSTTLQLALHQSHLHEKSNELNSCLEQLTYDMEEQTWLRMLAEQMRLCDVRVTVKSVAVEVLTSLQGLIYAESVALFRSGSSPADNHVTWVGPQLVNDQFWRRWLWEEEGTTSPLPKIANGGRVEPPFRASGVNSIVAVPLTSSGRVSGWLVAVNRLTQEAGAYNGFAASEMEFGTVEASLMAAAATLIATHSHNVDLLHEQEALVLGVIRSMSRAIDARDPYTRGHSDRVGWYAQLIAEQMGLPTEQRDRIYICGLLHDVGKIGVPDHILLKPDRLTDAQFDMIKQHPQTGYDIVKNLKQFDDLLPGILHHHEAIDGSGYPRGLMGEEIPLQARILAVADSFDAMTSDRPYRNGMSDVKAFGILREQSGIQWDAGVVRAFLQIPVEKRQGHLRMGTDGPCVVEGSIEEFITPATINADIDSLLAEVAAEHSPII
ncbi:MAG: HD-GYP domain-containing protein [Planctomycetaceae bacterium]|nr:HD-GYP domain-containing protein [Planctomycetaceae bacterium]